MDPRDALRAIEVGCDGILVSNHGGRQLDQAPGSLDVLPAIKAAVGDRLTLLLDSGVRRGADILIALCLGADFCFFGRPTLYGAAAGGLARNQADFHRHQLLPRYLVDVSKRDQSQTIFGRKFNSPFGISPTGGVGLYQRRGGELLLAEAARDANIPYIMSGGSNASMEEAARIAPNNTWFQMYAAKDAAVTDALVGRARDNGLGALVLTVDVPVHPKRERNYRNGFATVRNGGVLEALKLKSSIILEALTHPVWVYDYV